MFDGLMAFFVGIWNGLKYLFDVGWKWIHNVWGWYLILLISLFHLAKHTTEFLLYILSKLPTSADIIADWTNPTGTLGGVFGLANFVFPLDELFGAFVIIFGLWVLGAIYRLIKSWIPTLA